MKSRFVASAALSTLVLLGATGCAFVTPQASTIQYSASDGVNVPDSDGPLVVRNALVVANEDGSIGNLIAAVINDTDKGETLSVEVGDLAPITVTVPANSNVSFGSDAEPLRIEGLDTIPGATVEIYFQSGDATGSAIDVPVLDGALPYYADLVPSDEDEPLTEVVAEDDEAE